MTPLRGKRPSPLLPNEIFDGAANDPEVGGGLLQVRAAGVVEDLGDFVRHCGLV